MTTNSASLNRTLFLEDNLPVLRGLDSESIDLIATDPPFNKGVRVFEGTTKAGDDVGFKDVWHWGDVHTDWTASIFKDHPRLYNVIQTANAAAGDDMGAFLCWMGVRVLEMHRVLKPTGSFYLHCDQTASHYLKAMLDAIFGRKQFRNEVVWSYRRWAGKARQYQRMHDTIFYYVKGSEYTWNWPMEPKAGKTPKYKRWNERDPVTGKLTTKSDKNVVVNETNMRDVWEVSWLQSQSKERTGYPTQKPLALYKRMIAASSNPGDMVLDPFAGCATTCVAAEQLERQWIGIDIQEKAGDVIRERLQNEVNGSMAWNDIVRTPTEAPERTDGGEPVAPELVVVGRRRSERRLPVREVREQLIVRDGQRCQGCGWEPPYSDYLQVDHKRPRSLGGVDDMDNLTLLCDPCNRMKSNKLTLSQLRQARESEGRMNADWYENEGKWK